MNPTLTGRHRSHKIPIPATEKSTNTRLAGSWRRVSQLSAPRWHHSRRYRHWDDPGWRERRQQRLGPQHLARIQIRATHAYEVISIGCLGKQSAGVGIVERWCRMSRGSCFSKWCRKRHCDLRAVVGEGTATVKCWPRSCSWRPRAARGSNCPQFQGIPPVRSRRGPRRRKPGKLHADKGYDYAHLRRWLSKRGIRHRIAAKELGPRSGWVVTVGLRTDHVLARRLSSSPPPLRAQSRALSRVHEHLLHPHLLPPACQLMCARNRFTARSWP